MDATVKTFMEFHSVPKRDGDLAVPGALFALVLDRSFCRPDPGWQRRPGGRPHDSIKPLAAHGFDPARTIIIDDSLRKILPDEHGSAIILPEYVTAADPACASEPHDTPLPVREPDGTEDPLTIPCQMPVLRVLACLLLHHVRGVDGDIRPALEHVRADLEQALSTGNLPDCLAHIQDTPPQPGVGELPLVFLSPPEQPRYGMPRLMDQ